MSEIEVPLEETQEHMHHAAHEHGGWMAAVALSTAIIATLAAVTALKAAYCEAEEMKTHTEVFDRWAQYQAKGIKKEIYKAKIDIIAALKNEKPQADLAAIEKYDNEQKEITKMAHSIEQTSKRFDNAHAKLALGVTLFQSGDCDRRDFAMLTKKKPFWYVSLVLGAAGVVMLIVGYTSIPVVAEEGGEKDEAKPAEALEGRGGKGQGERRKRSLSRTVNGEQ